MSAAPFRLGFDVRFEEAVKAARARKVVLPEAFYADLPVQARARAFTVSGLASLDQIARVFESLKAATAEGTSFGEWQRSQAADLGALPAARRELIFRNAVQNHYNAGRWAQIDAHAARRPFVLFSGIEDRRQTAICRDLDGLILPADDPYWTTHSPQLHHACRSHLLSLTEAQARARGWTPGARGPQATADAGFGTRPDRSGATRALVRRVRKKAADLPAPLPEVVEKAVVAPAGDADWTLDALITAGAEALERIAPARRQQTTMQRHTAVLEYYVANVETGTPARVRAPGRRTADRELAKTVARAGTVYPKAWMEIANAAGELVAVAQKRGYMFTAVADGPVKLPGFEGVLKRGQAVIAGSPGDTSTAVHELAHRLQATLNVLDERFQELHRRRTQGAKLRDIREVNPNYLGVGEMTREDSYLTPYQGREYTGGQPGGALEVMTIAFEYFFGPTGRASRLLEEDPEIYQLVLGMLLNLRGAPRP